MPHDAFINEEFDDTDLSSELEDEAQDDEFEEITSEEVDRVVEALDQLIHSVDSENIRWFLEEAAGSIFSLIYDDEHDEVSDLDSEAA